MFAGKAINYVRKKFYNFGLQGATLWSNISAKCRGVPHSAALYGHDPQLALKYLRRMELFEIDKCYTNYHS
jgi:hypothetical protein